MLIYVTYTICKELQESKECVMDIATVTSKGQITIPVSIRKQLGIGQGDKVLFYEGENGVIMVNASKQIDFSKLQFKKTTKSIADALENEEPFEWPDDVINGNRKVEMKVGRSKQR